MTDQAVPPLTFDPLALSIEHHLLRALDTNQPTTRAQAVAMLLSCYPGLKDLGTPEQPSARVARAWKELTGERSNGVPWVRYVPQRKGGFVLTGAGEARLAVLHHNQVVSPYIRALEASHGQDVARKTAEKYQRR